MKNNIKVYSAVFNPSADGGYEVSFPDFPGCVTFGATFEEAQKMAAEVLDLWIEELAAGQQRIPAQTQKPIIADVKVAFA